MDIMGTMAERAVITAAEDIMEVELEVVTAVMEGASEVADTEVEEQEQAEVEAVEEVSALNATP